MRILILGGDGMLGHQLLISFKDKHEVKVTLRNNVLFYQNITLFSDKNSYFGVNILDDDSLLQILADFKPEVVINAVGVIKQRDLAKQIIPSLQINALFPHRLAMLCKLMSSRLISISTDCVFSGKKGNYTEDDLPDAEDIYGRTKLLGEVGYDGCLTLRSSIIGLEFFHKKSLIEWFLQQKGTIKGFSKVIYTGVTTMEMARIIEYILNTAPSLSGIFQVASKPISKYELLSLLVKKLNKTDVKIVVDDTMDCDRSLVGTKFTTCTNYRIPSWDAMLDELALIIKENKTI